MVSDPQGAIAESNKANNYGLGQGYDLSMVTITPHLQSNLVGASLGVYPDVTTWGSTVKVTAQILNDAAGDAPPTRARVVLTPTGAAPGGPSDVTIADLNVPAIPANQTAVVTQDVTLPSAPPSAFATISQYTLSIVQDADFATNLFSPHFPTKGLGFDQVPFSIAAPSDPNVALGPRPDLAVGNVNAPSQPIGFGQTFQVTATVENLGNLDSQSYRVRYLLVGTNNDLGQAIFLGDATVKGLKAGYAQDVVQTLKFPSRMPTGVTLSPTGRIAVEIDPEGRLDEPNRSNNAAVSGVVNLSLVQADGTSVPLSAATLASTSKPVAPAKTSTPLKPTGTTPASVNPAAPPGAKKALAKARVPGRPVKPAKHTLSHNLSVFPKHVSHYLNKLIKNL
jgi:hypothetical protein